jgi:hypothetical protein
MLTKVKFNPAINDRLKELRLFYTDRENFNKNRAKQLLWDKYINPDKPTTFAKKPQDIENISLFQEETFQLYIYLLEKYNNFAEVINLKPNIPFEFIHFMSPGKDKPNNLVYWDKCILASLLCGLAPTEEQFNHKSYNQINLTLIKKRIIPLLYLLLNHLNTMGDFTIVKSSKEDTSMKLKNGKSYYIHTLSIMKLNNTIELKPDLPIIKNPDLELTPENYSLMKLRYEYLTLELEKNKLYLNELNKEYEDLMQVMSELGIINN